ncbi:MAG: hypothetical protein IKL27_06580 [Oscillospiraceae bacterium]|nr:hypothetical protein [Oscillospiraceae bacterium]
MDITLERMLSLIPRKADGKYVHGEKKKFCEKIGAPANIVSEWEAGKTKSYRNYIHATAMAYDVSIEWLRGQTDEKKPAPEGELSEERREVLSMIDGMSDKELIRLKQLIKIAKEGL